MEEQVLVDSKHWPNYKYGPYIDEKAGPDLKRPKSFVIYISYKFWLSKTFGKWI